MNDYTFHCYNLNPSHTKADAFVEFDGYRIWNLGAARFVNELAARAQARRPTRAFYLNAWTYVLAASDKAFRQTIRTADILYPDGISVTGACRLAGVGRPARMTAGDFFEDFCRTAQDARLKVYFLAGKPYVIDRAMLRLRSRFPRLEIVGHHHGYLGERPELTDFVIGEINRRRPDVLVVGMGSPKQESFVARHSGRLDVPVVWTVGAMLDYVAGTERLAPRWVGRAGLEWLYRLWQDPAGKWKRYLLGNAEFVARVSVAAIRERVRE